MPKKSAVTGTNKENADAKEKSIRYVLVFKESLYEQFKTLCHIAETEPSKFLIDYVNRVVSDNQDLIKEHTENKTRIKL